MDTQTPLFAPEPADVIRFPGPQQRTPGNLDGRSLTVRDAFDELLLAELRELNRSENTIKQYRRAIERWEEFWRIRDRPWYANPGSPGSPGIPGYGGSGRKEGSTSPLSPPLAHLTRSQFVELRAWLQDTSFRRGPLGKRSIDKVVEALGAILNCASRHSVTHFQRPDLSRLAARATKAGRKLYLDYDELSALYNACSCATWPTRNRDGQRLHASPADQWRAAVVWYFNFGFRTQELIRYEDPDKPTLCWSNVSRDPETPSEVGKAVNRYGWIWYVPGKQEWIKDEALVLPINEVCDAHLRLIEPPNGPRPESPIFNWSMASDSFYGQWKLIVHAAGIKPKKSLKDGHQPQYAIKHLRKTCTTWHNYYRPGIAPLITGHAPREARGDDPDPDKSLSTVSAIHYDNPERAVLDAMNDLKQPDAFEQAVRRVDPQKRLF